MNKEPFSEEPAETAIRLEKAMLNALGRRWTLTGISVESLVCDMIADNERLRAALLKYGDHLATCRVRSRFECNCGWGDFEWYVNQQSGDRK